VKINVQVLRFFKMQNILVLKAVKRVDSTYGVLFC